LLTFSGYYISSLNKELPFNKVQNLGNLNISYSVMYKIFQHLAQNSLSSHLLSKHVKIKMTCALHGCETWSLTLREEHSECT
jgi:hypothetical protein